MQAVAQDLSYIRPQHPTTQLIVSLKLCHFTLVPQQDMSLRLIKRPSDLISQPSLLMTSSNSASTTGRHIVRMRGAFGNKSLNSDCLNLMSGKPACLTDVRNLPTRQMIFVEPLDVGGECLWEVSLLAPLGPHG